MNIQVTKNFIIVAPVIKISNDMKPSRRIQGPLIASLVSALIFMVSSNNNLLGEDPKRQLSRTIEELENAPREPPSTFPAFWSRLEHDIDVHIIGKYRERAIDQNGKLVWNQKIYPSKYSLILESRNLDSWKLLVNFGKENVTLTLRELKNKWSSQIDDDLGLLDDVRPVIPFLFLEILGRENELKAATKSRDSVNAFLSDSERINEIINGK